MKFTMAQPEESCHPEQLLPGARTVVSAALCYYTPEPERPPGRGRLPRYTWHDAYAELREKLDALGRELGGAYRVLVDANQHVDREGAARSGVGFYGKNTLLITQRHGSWVVLGTLVTDAELEPTPPLDLDCGDCRLCIDACPTGALDEPGTLDARRCLSYWTQAAAPIPEDVPRAPRCAGVRLRHLPGRMPVESRRRETAEPYAARRERRAARVARRLAARRTRRSSRGATTASTFHGTTRAGCSGMRSSPQGTPAVTRNVGWWRSTRRTRTSFSANTRRGRWRGWRSAVPDGRVDALEAANRCARALGSWLELKNAFGAFIGELSGLVPFDRTAIVLVDEDAATTIATAGRGANEVFPPGAVGPLQGSVLERVLDGQIVVRRDLAESEFPEDERLVALGLHSELVAPLLLGTEPIGMLSLSREDADAFTEEEVELVALLGRLVATAVQNIRAYEAERATVEELRRLSDLRADFVSLVSHELRSPLAAVIGAARTLQERRDELTAEQHDQLLSLIAGEAGRLTVLVADVLDTSRIEAGTFSYQFGEVDVASLIEDVVDDRIGAPGRDLRPVPSAWSRCRRSPATASVSARC